MGWRESPAFEIEDKERESRHTAAKGEGTIRISRSMMAVSGVVVAAAAIGFTNPKAVHALAAALVQVTNTAANPVVTQSAREQAGQIIHLRCYQMSGTYGVGACALMSGFIPETTAYVVPANQSLVITSVDLLPTQTYVSNSCGLTHQDTLNVTQGSSANDAQEWVLSNASVHDTYPSGIVIGTGSSITGSAYYPNPPASCLSSIQNNDQFDLYGYLTTN